jgi:hypothetical protein
MIEHGVALTLARYRAKQIVKERWRAQGHRLTEVEPRDVIEWAETLIVDQPELLEQALEEVRQSPELQRTVRSRQRFFAKLSSDAQRR